MWRTGLVPRVWTEAGVYGRLGRNAAGRVEAESLLLPDTVTARGTNHSCDPSLLISYLVMVRSGYKVSSCDGWLMHQHRIKPADSSEA